ncbi:hypothetical protein [Helicobacter himalayensis]|uniref:hypothetical protein n=1 Tax=Helicobacter himalayensis TaxID=1591088 RepID=UPI00083388E7|nr:hypothetical protein [Helicobacter himalayensis]
MLRLFFLLFCGALCLLQPAYAQKSTKETQQNLTNFSTTSENIELKLQEPKDLQDENIAQESPKKSFGIKVNGGTSAGYSELELNQKTFQENEIESGLWRAGLGYDAFYEFYPINRIVINLFFGSSVEITQYRVGGKVKNYNDGIRNEDHAYDWGERFYAGSRINHIGVVIRIYENHKLSIVLRRAFLADFRLGNYDLPFSNSPWVSSQNVQISGSDMSIRAINNTQILVSYSLYF